MIKYIYTYIPSSTRSVGGELSRGADGAITHDGTGCGWTRAGFARGLELLRLGADRVHQLHAGQRVPLELHPPPAQESGAQGDAAGDPVDPGAAAPAATPPPREAQRSADVHVRPVQRHVHGGGRAQVLVPVQTRLHHAGAADSQPARQQLLERRRHGHELRQFG